MFHDILVKIRKQHEFHRNTVDFGLIHKIYFCTCFQRRRGGKIKAVKNTQF